MVIVYEELTPPGEGKSVILPDISTRDVRDLNSRFGLLLFFSSSWPGL
jgi:hypothetical protein